MRPRLFPSFARRMPSPASADRVMPVSCTACPISSSHGLSRLIWVVRPAPSVPSSSNPASRKIRRLQVRQELSVSVSHGLILRFFALSRCACTIWRTCACCTSTDRVASTTVRPNSWNHFFVLINNSFPLEKTGNSLPGHRSAPDPYPLHRTSDRPGRRRDAPDGGLKRHSESRTQPSVSPRS